MANQHFKLILTASLFLLFTDMEVFAQTGVANTSKITSNLFNAPNIGAALIAAAVTIIVNIVGKLILDKRLETFKAELASKETANEAKVQYEMEAKKRLYNAIGTLRFQLLLSARDLSSHIILTSTMGRKYPTTTENYYGKSTIYKLIKPFSLCELIEKQISIADFSIDPEAIDLLRLKRAIYAAFSSDRPILQHPDANWEIQEQHIFYNSLSRISNSLISKDSSSPNQIMAFHEFEDFIPISENSLKIAPLPKLLDGFIIQEKPILWLRLVLIGFLCSEIVNQKGVVIGFEKIDYPLKSLIEATEDKYILLHSSEIIKQFKLIRDAGI